MLPDALAGARVALGLRLGMVLALPPGRLLAAGLGRLLAAGLGRLLAAELGRLSATARLPAARLERRVRPTVRLPAAAPPAFRRPPLAHNDLIRVRIRDSRPSHVLPHRGTRGRAGQFLRSAKPPFCIPNRTPTVLHQ
ncbi:MAG: hypothetical protein JSR66_00265 [Proteobacteria bacterium]|nr:hypothetical protein [Pseudomonadota bacterium]